MKYIITKILNRFGYYKLDQLQIGGHCGICGRFQSNEIVIPEKDGEWTLYEKCSSGNIIR